MIWIAIIGGSSIFRRCDRNPPPKIQFDGNRQRPITEFANLTRRMTGKDLSGTQVIPAGGKLEVTWFADRAGEFVLEATSESEPVGLQILVTGYPTPEIKVLAPAIPGSVRVDVSPGYHLRAWVSNPGRVPARVEFKTQVVD